jgi:hypothetical protein
VPTVALDGPPAPVAPAVINRDDKGHATIRATRIDQPLKIDGRLDEEVYVTVPGASDFVQQLPRENRPATEQTELGGTLVGVETPLQSLNLELKPYAVSSINTDRTATVPYSNDVAKNARLDFK